MFSQLYSTVTTIFLNVYTVLLQAAENKEAEVKENDNSVHPSNNMRCCFFHSKIV
jgi:hypothetical protein